MAKTKEELIKELYYWRTSRVSTNWFSGKVFELIAKADPFNKLRFRDGFGDYLEVFTEWENSPSEEEFFRGSGICLPREETDSLYPIPLDESTRKRLWEKSDLLLKIANTFQDYLLLKKESEEEACNIQWLRGLVTGMALKYDHLTRKDMP